MDDLKALRDLARAWADWSANPTESPMPGPLNWNAVTNTLTSIIERNEKERELVPDTVPMMRMEALKAAILARDWDDTEFQFDRVLRAMNKERALTERAKP